MIYNSFTNFPWNSLIFYPIIFPAQEIISHWICECYFCSFDGNHCKYLGYALFFIISHLSPGWRQPLPLLRPYSLFILCFRLRPKDSGCSVHCSNASFPLPRDCGPDPECGCCGLWVGPRLLLPLLLHTPVLPTPSPAASSLLLQLGTAPLPPWFMPPSAHVLANPSPVLCIYS